MESIYFDKQELETINEVENGIEAIKENLDDLISCSIDIKMLLNELKANVSKVWNINVSLFDDKMNWDGSDYIDDIYNSLSEIDTIEIKKDISGELTDLITESKELLKKIEMISSNYSSCVYAYDAEREERNYPVEDTSSELD